MLTTYRLLGLVNLFVAGMFALSALDELVANRRWIWLAATSLVLLAASIGYLHMAKFI